MKTQELFELLNAHQNKTLQFEYSPNRFVSANYHITEVKHITVDSVDCGSQMDSWNETIIQLWESPSETDRTKHMSVLKALGILKKVGKMKAYDLNAEVKFEYSNTSFHTAQLFVNDFIIQNNNLILMLAVEKTDCKAKSICGIQEEVKETVAAEPCCDPNGNCC